MIVLEGAKFALEHSTSIVNAFSEPASNKKPTIPWYYKLFFAGSVIAAAAAIALAALQIYAAALAAIASAISCGVAAYFTKKFVLFKSLAGYTSDLTGRVQQLVVLIGQLREGTKKLEEINLDLQKIPREWESQILQEKKLLQDNKENLHQIDRQEKRGKEQLDRFYLLLEELKKQNNQISASVLQFGDEHDHLKEEIKKLKTSLDLWNKQTESFKKQTGALTQETERLEQMMSVYQKQNAFFESLFDVLKKMYVMFPKQMKNIHQEVEKLTNAIPGTKKSTDNLEQIADRLEQILKNRKDYKQFLKWQKEQKK